MLLCREKDQESRSNGDSTAAKAGEDEGKRYAEYTSEQTCRHGYRRGHECSNIQGTIICFAADGRVRIDGTMVRQDVETLS